VTDATAFSSTSGSVSGKGLTINRIYTTEGVHPYDQVNWEFRDVVQTNWKNGETIFELPPSSQPNTSAEH
jgi:ribonucleoside-diphosphate reductase alpha chain